MDRKTVKSIIETCGLSEPPREDMRVGDRLLTLLNELIERLIELGLEEQDESRAMRYFAAAKLVRFIEEEVKREGSRLS